MLPDLAFRITAQAATAAAFSKVKSDVTGIRGELQRISVFGRTMVTGLAGALSIGLFTNFIKGAVEAGSAVGDLANRTGLTAEQVQEFSFAVEQTGTSTESWSKAMIAMARLLGDAQRGLTTAQREFAALGLTMDDLRGKNPGQVFELIIQQIGKLSDPLQRNAALIKFFGRSGVEMAELVKVGAGAIETLRQKARDLGLVLSNEEIQKLKDAGDQINLIGIAGKTAGERMAIAFIPAIDALEKLVTSPEFQKGLSDTAGWIGSIVKFFAENPEAAKILGATGLAYRMGGPAAAALVGTAGTLLYGGANHPSRYDDEMSPDKARFLGNFAASPGGSLTSADVAAAYARKTLGDHPLGNFVDPAIEAQQKAYEKLAASLALALANLGATDREQAIANDVARLGADATDKQRASIALLSGQLFDEKKALADFNAEAQFFGQSLYDAFDALIVQGNALDDVLGNVIKSLAQAALQAALLGQGPLASLFGTAPATSGGLGGLIGAVASAFSPVAQPMNILPHFAHGGSGIIGGSGGTDSQLFQAMVTPGEPFAFGEAARRGGGASFTYAPQIDARGADAAAVTRLERVLAQDKASFRARVIEAVNTGNSRRMVR